MTATDDERDDAYRAVGRYVVEFSRMIFHMRIQVIGRITHGTGDASLGELALGDATAYQVATAFFAICREVSNFDADEQRIASSLEKAVNQVIKMRNDVAHGDWWVGFGRKESGEGGDPILWRVKPARRTGAFEARELPTDDLDALSEALYELRQHVAEFGDICFGRHPLELTGEKPRVAVRDIFVLVDGHVTRGGRFAGLRSVFYT